MNFIGEECPVCNNRFTADDDVVVCPECGTPHHRECYRLENKCVNESYHGTGFRWKRSSSVTEKSSSIEATINCPECGFLNKEADEKCVRCGTRLHSDVIDAQPSRPQQLGQQNGPQGTYFDPFRGAETANGQETVYSFLGFNPEEDMGGATLTEVTGFVRSNIIYYLPIFKRMKDLGTKISFNLSCFIFPNLYFAYRKMWLWAVIATIIEVFFSLPSMIFVMADMSAEGGFTIPGISVLTEFASEHKDDLNAFNEIFSMAFFMVKLIFSLFANWLYYRFTLSSLKKIKMQSPDHTVKTTALLLKGGAKAVNMILIIAITGLISSAALALFATYPKLLDIFVL